MKNILILNLILFNLLTFGQKNDFEKIKLNCDNCKYKYQLKNYTFKVKSSNLNSNELKGFDSLYFTRYSWGRSSAGFQINDFDLESFKSNLNKIGFEYVTYDTYKDDDGYYYSRIYFTNLEDKQQYAKVTKENEDEEKNKLNYELPKCKKCKYYKNIKESIKYVKNGNIPVTYYSSTYKDAKKEYFNIEIYVTNYSKYEDDDLKNEIETLGLKYLFNINYEMYYTTSQEYDKYYRLKNNISNNVSNEVVSKLVEDADKLKVEKIACQNAKSGIVQQKLMSLVPFVNLENLESAKNICRKCCPNEVEEYLYSFIDRGIKRDFILKHFPNGIYSEKLKQDIVAKGNYEKIDPLGDLQKTVDVAGQVYENSALGQAVKEIGKNSPQTDNSWEKFITVNSKQNIRFIKFDKADYTSISNIAPNVFSDAESKVNVKLFNSKGKLIKETTDLSKYFGKLDIEDFPVTLNFYFIQNEEVRTANVTISENGRVTLECE